MSYKSNNKLKLVLVIVMSLFIINLISAFSGNGTGNSTNPFEITNCTQVDEIRNNMTANYILMNDVDCWETHEWNNFSGFEPIGNNSELFNGTLDGQNYIISDLYIYRLYPFTIKNVGLFYYVNNMSIISNLRLENYSFFGNIGGSITTYNNGTINNCHTNGELTLSDVEDVYIGGITAFNFYNGKIANSSSLGVLYGASVYVGTGHGGNVRGGGFVGMNYGNINNSYSNVDITGVTSASPSSLFGGGFGRIGGFVGMNYGTINSSYSLGNSTYNAIYPAGDSGGWSAGFVGENKINGKIYNSYSRTKVSATFGGATLYNIVKSGGFVVGSDNLNITNSYSTGVVTCRSPCSSYGFGSVTFNNSYFDTNTSGIAGGKTTLEMKNIRTFTDRLFNPSLVSPVWDFVGTLYNDTQNNNIWNINASINDGYPYLPLYNFYVLLNSPSNGSSQILNVTFNCSSVSQSNLTNTTLSIWNYSSNQLVYSETKNITGLTNTTTFDYNFSETDDYLWNCRTYNLDNLYTTANNNTLYISKNTPAINLISPNNTQFLNYSIVNFSFNALDVDNISSCELWSNFTGNWSKNYTWSSFSSGITQSINRTLLNGFYVWNVWCNDTLNFSDFSINNYTMGIDTIQPISNSLDVTTTLNSQSFLFLSNVTETNPYNCKYTVKDENDSINGINENIVFACNQLTSATTFGFGNFTLYVDFYDIVGNYIQQNQTFTTTFIPVGGGGTPTGSVTSTGQPILTSGNWTIETELGSDKYQFNMIQSSSRTKDLILENLGLNSRTITLSCEKVSGTSDLCDGITFTQNNFNLPVQKSTKTSVGFSLKVPSNIEKGTYIINLVAKDEANNKGVITVEVKITSRASITGAITKLFSDTDKGIPYALFFFLIVFIFGFLSNYIILKPNKLPSALSVIFGLIVGFVFLLLPL